MHACVRPVCFRLSHLCAEPARSSHCISFSQYLDHTLCSTRAWPLQTTAHAHACILACTHERARARAHTHTHAAVLLKSHKKVRSRTHRKQLRGQFLAEPNREIAQNLLLVVDPTHTHTHRKRERETDRESERESARKSERARERESARARERETERGRNTHTAT